MGFDTLYFIGRRKGPSLTYSLRYNRPCYLRQAEKIMMKLCSLLVFAVCLVGFAQTAEAIFHFMQIEQVIGGVNGDTTTQAIQLRMRGGFQNEVQFSRLIARDANGLNPIVLIDNMTSVENDQGGDRVLITTASFGDYTDITLQSDFTFINPIPTSYLSAGQIAYQT